MIFPGKDDYLAIAKPGLAHPISSEILADIETPLSAFWKLSHGENHSFLLESVTGGEQVGRYSILGARPRLTFRGSLNHVTLRDAKGQARKEWSDLEDPLAPLRDLVPQLNGALPAGIPAFCHGAVGTIGYDYVRTIERLPHAPPNDLKIDPIALMIPDVVVVFDHVRNMIKVVAFADGSAEDYDRAVRSLEWALDRLRQPLPALPSGRFLVHPVASSTSQAEYEEKVRRCIDYITAGDAQQLVPSLRFDTEIDAHPLTVYRALRSLNPSPYMFLLQFNDVHVVGASPEILVSLEGRKARVRPIAGTRPRGEDLLADRKLAEELLADEKERAEHIMLVDLGRNDLGRVCDYGSVKVNDLMVIERYSHVMHIVSDVTGTLREGMDTLELLRASFPAGTLSGSPKIRAMEIIDELESSSRGIYSGAVGFFHPTGDTELAIAIRTIVMRAGRAHVQAGAGVVYDSNPTKEYEECCNKARACLKAIEMAQQGL